MGVDRVELVVIIFRDRVVDQKVSAVELPSPLEVAAQILVAGCLDVALQRTDHIPRVEVVDERSVVAAGISPRSILGLAIEHEVDRPARRIQKLLLARDPADARKKRCAPLLRWVLTKRS